MSKLANCFTNLKNKASIGAINDTKPHFKNFLGIKNNFKWPKLCVNKVKYELNLYFMILSNFTKFEKDPLIFCKRSS